MRISLLDDNDVVTSIVIGELENFPNGVEDTGHKQGDTVDPITGAVLVPYIEPVITHLENFTTEQMHESFTSDEAIAGLASTNPLVRAQAELLAMKRNKPMNKDDQGYQDAINLLESDGVLDASAATDYRSGIPVSRLQ
jgi:hypothetical protein